MHGAQQFAGPVFRCQFGADLDGAGVGHKITFPKIFFVGIGEVATLMAQGESDGVFKPMPAIGSGGGRIDTAQSVVNGVVFVGGDDALLEGGAVFGHGEQ